MNTTVNRSVTIKQLSSIDKSIIATATVAFVVLAGIVALSFMQ